jgi:hypothetical protein
MACWSDEARFDLVVWMTALFPGPAGGLADDDLWFGLEFWRALGLRFRRRPGHWFFCLSNNKNSPGSAFVRYFPGGDGPS